MVTMEMVEKLRERAGVSYEDAKAALDASGGDMLDAIIYLEKQGKATPPAGGFYSSGSAGAGIGSGAVDGSGDGEYEFGSGYASNSKTHKYKVSRASRDARDRRRAGQSHSNSRGYGRSYGCGYGKGDSRKYARREAEFSATIKKIGFYLGKALHFCNSTQFEVERKGTRVINLPLTIVALCFLFLFWASLVAIIAGLFFGFRYRFVSERSGSEPVNSVLDSAANAADTLKSKFKAG
jgi:hypothetical protein